MNPGKRPVQTRLIVFAMSKKKCFQLTLITISLICTSCHVGRYFIWNLADVRDYKKFSALEIGTSARATPFHKPVSSSFRALDDQTLSQMGFTSDTWDDVLSESGTLAFLVIRNDTLLYEKYLHGYDEQRIIPSFSVAKTFVSALVGAALEKGSIHSVDDPITDYLPYLPKVQFQKITIKDLLNMRSGIAFKESYSNPFGHAAKLYYGVNLASQLKGLKIAQKPNRQFDYVSVNTQLLGEILEEATGRPLNIQLEEEIWKPMGMVYPATWSVDSKARKTIKAFCCINARPVDFAKLGQLYLNKGQTYQSRVFSGSWYDQSIRFDTATNYFRYQMGWWFLPSRENLTESTDLSVLHMIWRDRKDNVDRELVYKPLGDFYAEGILGQFVYVNPEKKIVVVRMGKKEGKVKWVEVFRKISAIN